MPKGPLGPSNSTKFVHIGRRNQKRTMSWATWLKTRFRAHLRVVSKSRSISKLGFGHRAGGTRLGFITLFSLLTVTGLASNQQASQQASSKHARNGKNPPATTHFWWFPSLKIAPTPAAPRPNGLRRAARGSPKRWVSKWVNKVHLVQKRTFFKNDLRPHGMTKQVFLARCELVVSCFGSPKIPKCLENGLFWDKKWVKNVFFQK